MAKSKLLRVPFAAVHVGEPESGCSEIYLSIFMVQTTTNFSSEPPSCVDEKAKLAMSKLELKELRRRHLLHLALPPKMNQKVKVMLNQIPRIVIQLLLSRYLLFLYLMNQICWKS